METWAIVSICVLLGLTTRWTVSLNSYSGASKPPMFGDYEAQRHWQEVTYNIPVHQWYFNTTDNDLNYWGLDYPPLTAYHSLLCAHVANLINPDWVKLHSSRGFESPAHKLFMRATVIVADILIYIPAVVIYCLYLTEGSAKRKASMLLCVLLYPGLILIDNGHFQYNSISLGLALWGVLGLGLGWDLLGSLAFTLALNYKQMELYHALPFFCYLLGKCVRQGLTGRGLTALVKIAVTVLLSFALCWSPFLSDPQQAVQVARRLFPVGRGLFEDKVANTWCSLNVLIKIKTLLSPETQIYLRYPPSLNLFKMVRNSLASHSRPVCLLMNELPLVSVWFLQASTFSMLPLLLKDGLFLPYIVTSLGFLFFGLHLLSLLDRGTADDLRLGPLCGRLGACLPGLTFSSLVRWGVAALTFSSAVLAAPARFPDLFPVLVSTLTYAHFLGAFVYFSIVQLVDVPRRSSKKKAN
uniref:Alpha-1,3-glucosyltransferase n=1 Tax=Paramormyrops kingsleyae TaxID=1676925 RepID=A0A3B3SV72_9TELE